MLFIAMFALGCALAKVQHRFPVFQKLFAIITACNLCVWYGIDQQAGHEGIREMCLDGAAINMLTAILVRQPMFTNALYTAILCVPHSWPLSIRVALANLHHLGGIHSACAMSALGWLCLAARHTGLQMLPCTTLIAFVIITMATFAVDNMRTRKHDLFEKIHMAGIICCVLLLGILAWQDTQHRFFGSTLHICTIGSIVMLVASWRTHQPLLAHAEQLSTHAVRVYLPNISALPGSAIKLSIDGSQYHPFAIIPNTDGTTGSSVIISRVGDWTSSEIDKARHHKQAMYWLRGGPVYGVITLARLFKRVVLIATGSGIAPMLSLVGSGSEGQYQLFWSCKKPRNTYGISLSEEVVLLDPMTETHDTTKHEGRPDLVERAFDMYKITGAEAAFVVSNRKGTEGTVAGLQTLGVPAYGPIFDA